MLCSFNKIDHMGSRMNRQRMLGKAGPGRDVSCHFANQVELSIGCFCEQRDQQILKCDHANAQLHQLGIY